MAGIGDEIALALERLLQAIEHLVQRLAETLHLVAGGRHGQPFARRLGADHRGPPPHRLHLTQGEAGQQIPDPAGEDQCDRTRDEKLVAKARERLCVVLRRRADHEHCGPPVSRHGRREHA